MEDKLIELLSVYGYPVIRQGSLSENEAYPDHFFTFWNFDTYSQAHYDGNPESLVYAFDVNFYSIDPSKVYEVITQVTTDLKDFGFMIESYGHDVASDEPTHTGRGIEIRFRT